jgi:anti-sigma-K factor RskA
MSRSHRECDWGHDVAAYALGALEPAEAETFRAHLNTCPACRDELAVFQRVADSLPRLAPAQPVPAGLRRRVLAEVRRPAARSSRIRRLAAGWTRPALAAAAVLAVVAVAALRLSPGPALLDRHYAAHVTVGGNAQLAVRSGRGQLALTGFTPPPAGDIYEVWVKHGAGLPQPTDALFGVNRTGSAHVGVPGQVGPGTTVMVTPEPQGGSRVPTHPPVLVVSIS